MTIASQSNKTIVAGDGVTTQFAFGFVGVASAYITVIFQDASGNQTVLTQGSGATQYQIALNSPVTGAIWGVGGIVTYSPSGTPIAVGTTLTIFRTLPLTQAISLQFLNSLANLGDGAETGLDTVTMELQQISETINRAILAPVTDATPPAPLPPIAQRANKGAAFDAFGNLIAGVTPASGIISSAMAPVVSAASLALGRTAFGLGAMAVEGIGLGLADDGAGNVQVLPPLVQVASNQAVAKANHTSTYMASGALTFTLARANTLFNGFYVDVYALTGAITFAINANDNFFGAGSGVSYTIPKGSAARISTNAASSGTWFAEVTGISPKPNIVIFTTSGTYTPSAGLLFAIVEGVGAGGAGGGAVVTANIVGGGGGQAGAYARTVVTAAQVGTSQAVTIGAGGAGNSGGGGNAGTASSLGALLIAAGGAGGIVGLSPGPGGTGGNGAQSSTGSLIIPGGDGEPGFFSTVNALGPGGRGGSSVIGAGGRALIANSGTGFNGPAGKNYGGGGAGGGTNNSTAVAGGAGAPGLIYITEYLAAVA